MCAKGDRRLLLRDVSVLVGSEDNSFVEYEERRPHQVQKIEMGRKHLVDSSNEAETCEEDSGTWGIFSSSTWSFKPQSMLRVDETHNSGGEVFFVQRRLKRTRSVSENERFLFHFSEADTLVPTLPFIKLNVGGVRFNVPRSILLQFPATIFSLLDERTFLVDRDEQGYVLFDRNPLLFSEILFLLQERQQRVAERTQQVCGHLTPYHFGLERIARLSHFERKQLIDEARFYGLNELVVEVFTKRHEWKQCVFTQLMGHLRSCEDSDMRPVVSHSLELPEGFLLSSGVLVHDNIYVFCGCVESEGTAVWFFRLQIDNNGNDEFAIEEKVEGCAFDDSVVPQVGLRHIYYDLIQPALENGFETKTLPAFRLGHAMVSTDDLYLLLFYGNNLTRHVNDVWAYNTMKNTWVQLKLGGDFVAGRSGHTVTVVLDRMYLIGGKNVFGSSACVFAEIFEGRFSKHEMEFTWRSLLWSPQQWEESDCSGVPRVAYHSAVEYNGRYIIVFGDTHSSINAYENCNGGGGGAPLQLYLFDTFSKNWSCMRTFIDSSSLTWSDIPVSGHAAVCYKDDMYVIGSFADGQQLGLFQISIQCLIWRRIQTTVAPTRHFFCGRAAPSVVLIQPATENFYPLLFVCGGYDIIAKKYANDAYLILL